MLIINVNMSGEPTPSVNWMLNGRQLDRAPGVSIETGSDHSNLTVKGTTAGHAGKYTITAQNEVGTATADFQVQVIGKSI